MKIVCACCGRDTGEKDSKDIEGACLGVCGVCVARLEARRAVNHPIWLRLNILLRYLANDITPN